MKSIVVVPPEDDSDKENMKKSSSQPEDMVRVCFKFQTGPI